MAIKAQVLADFIVEFTYIEGDEPLDTSVELTKEGEGKEQNGDMMIWRLFVDGSSNHNGCVAGLILQTPLGEQIEYAIHIEFKATTNEAEYEALLVGLRIASEFGVESLYVFSDSQLVVNKVQGDYLVEDPKMMAYLDEVKYLAIKIKSFRI